MYVSKALKVFPSNFTSLQWDEDTGDGHAQWLRNWDCACAVKLELELRMRNAYRLSWATRGEGLSLVVAVLCPVVRTPCSNPGYTRLESSLKHCHGL